MLEYRFDLSKFPRMSIKSFHIREVTGEDEQVAALAAEAKGKSTSMLQELVRLSISQVEDAPVDAGTFTAFDKWSSRTRTAVMNAFKAINGMDDKAEISPLLSAALPALGGSVG